MKLTCLAAVMAGIMLVAAACAPGAAVKPQSERTVKVVCIGDARVGSKIRRNGECDKAQALRAAHLANRAARPVSVPGPR